MNIPTKDRCEILKYTLEYEINFLEKYNISINILDSSDDDRTKNLISDYKQKYNWLDINYHFYPSDTPYYVKTIDTFFIGIDEADYVLSCGDGRVLTEEYFKQLFLCMNKGFKIIVMEIDDVSNLGNRIYYPDEQLKFFRDCSPVVTLLGGATTHSSLSKAVNKKELLLKYKDSDIIQSGFYFESIIKIKDFTGIYISKSKVAIPNPYRKFLT
jgi:hypothetical protein